MEGLKITNINISEVQNQKDFRLESDYWNQNNNINYIKLKGEDIISFVQYGTSEALNEINEGFPILRLNEFDSFFIGKPTKYSNIISTSEFESLKLLKDDVLICRTNGNPNLVGKSAYVPENTEYAFASYLYKIRPKKEKISPQTLVTFLNSKFGRQEINKYSMTSNQTNFSPAKFRQIDIPILSGLFNTKIDLLIDNSYKSLKQSKHLYFQAETLLLETLGLHNFSPNSDKINIKSLNDSFLSTGRLDAEYYQKKYEEILDAIINYKEGFNKLSYYISNYSTGYPYKSETYTDIGIPLIRINNINNGELDLSDTTCIPFSDISLSPKDIAIENDILISMSGTIGNSCKIPHGIKAVINQRIMRISPKNINSNVMPLIINSLIGKYQLERIGTGGVQTNISSTDIKEILIPNINIVIQQNLGSLIEESFQLKQESESLLNLAKSAVELAIEQGEDKALNFIEKLN